MTRWVPGVSIWRQAKEASVATPDGRDRVVDLLRVASLTVVVLGHALMAVVVWRGDTPAVANLLAEIPTLKIATWALQVMPVFFAAGAISNRVSYLSARGRGEPWRAWVWQRERRLVRPLFIYLALWVPLVLILEASLPAAAGPLGRLSTQLLWFLGVYLVVTVTTPWQVRLARHGLVGALSLLIPIALVDLMRFHLAGAVAVVNFGLVWFMAATLGLVVRGMVATGRGGRTRLMFLTLGALSVNTVVVGLLPYPLSMVGLPGESISNMAPPTLALALHSVVLIGAVGWAWPYLRRLCDGERAWTAIVAGGAVAMTLYLWHLTALVLVTVVEHELGLDRDGIGTGWFWIGTAAHLMVFLAVTAVLVSLMAPFEHLPVPWLEPPSARVVRPGRAAMVWSVLAGMGAVVSGVGLLVLAATGMAGFPWGRVTSYAAVPLTPALGMAMFLAGVLAARSGGRRRPTTEGAGPG